MLGRRRTRLTREGWYYLLVLAFVVTGAMLREINLLMMMAGLLIGPLLLNWRLAVASLRPLVASRRLASTVGVGEALSVEITVHSGKGWLPWFSTGGWAVTVEDEIRRVGAGSSATPLRSGVLFWHIARGKAQRVAYRGRLLRRGHYEFGPLTVSTRFPLGLVRRWMVVDAPQELIVLPRLGQLTPAWRAFCRRSLHADRGRRTQQAAPEGDFHSLREWRPGDARRQIHWRTTARRRTPVVRRLERPQNADVAVLLDLSTRRLDGDGEDPVTERAIGFVATVISDLCRQGVGWMLLGTAAETHQVFRGPTSAGLLRECMLHLATLESGKEDAIQPLLVEVLGNLRRDTRVVVVTTRGKSAGAGSAELTQGWMGAGGRPIEPALVIHAGSSELDEFYRGEEHSGSQP